MALADQSTVGDGDGEWNPLEAHMKKTLLWFRQPTRRTFAVQSTLLFFCLNFLAGTIAIGFYYGFKIGLAIFFLVIGFIINSHQLYFFYNQKSIEMLFYSFLELQQAHGDKKTVFEEESAKAWKIVNFFWWFSIVEATLYCAVPATVDSIVGRMIPSFPNINVPLPGQEIRDRLELRSLEHTILTGMVVIWSIINIVLHAGIEGLFVITLLYNQTEIKILHLMIMEAKEIPLSREFRQAREEALHNIICQHQRLIRVLDSVNVLFGFPIALQTTVISICGCVLLYSVVFTVLPIQDGRELFKEAMIYAFGAFIVFAPTLYICFAGETLQSLNEEMLEALYDLPWYIETPSYRKNLMMMIMKAQHPVFIEYRQIFRLNINTFVNIVNTSYSWFMFLTSTT